MSQADRFRQDWGAFSSSDNDHGLKRKLDCVDITTLKGKHPELIAVSDETGILHFNNFATGSILLSISNRRNKAEFTRIHFLKNASATSKLCLVATCADGRVMFFTRPNIQLDKESQSSDVVQTIVKKGTHEGELYSICSDDQWIAVGGRDNKVSFWKATCGTLSTTVVLPSARAEKS
jgi:WD40 repeat protein